MKSTERRVTSDTPSTIFDYTIYSISIPFPFSTFGPDFHFLFLSVTSQPMGFKANYLDSNSQSLYNSLNVKHMSGVDLTGRLNNAGNQLMETVQGRFVSLKVCKISIERSYIV